MFWGEERHPITFQGSQNDQMDHRKGIRVSIAQGLDESNFFKDVSKVPKFVPKWERPLITS